MTSCAKEASFNSKKWMESQASMDRPLWWVEGEKENRQMTLKRN